MREGCIKLGFVVVILSLIIYLVKNKEEIFNLLNSKIKNKKLFTKIIYIIIICTILFCLFIFIKSIIHVINVKNISQENESYFEEDDKKIEKEANVYEELMKKDYENQKYNEPYMLEGFSYVEGTWENGYVIEDEKHNQYVWIPCTNRTIKECVKLQRKNLVPIPFINYISCYNESYEKFLKSALVNGGFYVSRYEIGKEENVPVSKEDAEVWKNITKEEAIKIVDSMYDNINCEIINGYAYDTTLNWLEDTNFIRPKEDVLEIKKDEKILTGRNSKNNIYDFCDNVLEFSLENLYDTIIIRGFMNSDSMLYTNNIFSKENRYCIRAEDSSFGVITPIAIRTVLYK